MLYPYVIFSLYIFVDVISRALNELFRSPASMTSRFLKLPANQIFHQTNFFQLKVGVEDAESDCYVPTTVVVSAAMTIAQLKEKICHDFGFHPLLQRWVIGKRLAQDQKSLHSYGIRKSGDQAFLFILSAHAAHLTRHQHKLDQEQQRIETGKTPPPPLLHHPPKPVVAPKPQVAGLVLLGLYIVNKPTRPGCEMCGDERPEDYQVPNIYQPDQAEALRLEQEQLALLQYEQVTQLLEISNPNRKTWILYFDSKNMSGDQSTFLEKKKPDHIKLLYKPKQLLLMLSCHEMYVLVLRDCLIGTIQNSRDAEVSCPENCESKLLDREIKELLSDVDHQRFLEMRLSIAESRSEHSFHCQTPNCRGWCINEDEVNEFHCDICDATNCILCRAIHPNMNCKNYQDDLRIRAENDQAAQQTKQMLERMLQNGEAMNCPRCDVVVQKKDGCDWICCLMCRTEICWVTKQARWGPKGNGDISGGCRCRVNNMPCHPNCQNCH
uniref:RanBP-type and C3HC4-type zinc finger containing 1 n=1 Tax=Gouania willdenowi TaxID=441366 RepID=A0A8C5I2S9_GOUWI